MLPSSISTTSFLSFCGHWLFLWINLKSTSEILPNSVSLNLGVESCDFFGIIMLPCCFMGTVFMFLFLFSFFPHNSVLIIWEFDIIHPSPTHQSLHICLYPFSISPQLIKNKQTNKCTLLCLSSTSSSMLVASESVVCQAVYPFLQIAPPAKCSLQWVIGLAQGLWCSIITGPSLKLPSHILLLVSIMVIPWLLVYRPSSFIYPNRS